jgi:hypothetical protein
MTTKTARTLLGLLVVMLAAGCDNSRLRHVPPTPNAPGVDELMPDPDQVFKSARFSPDAGQIAFHVSIGTDRESVGVMNRDGSELKLLTDTHSALTSVAWAPDGTFIYFTSDKGIEQMAPTGGAVTHVVDATTATELDVSANGAWLLWVSNDNQLTSLKRNQAGATPTVEAHLGHYPRFDENGAVPGFVYVGDDGQGHRPLERDILGTGGRSGFVTMDLGAFPSVSVLGGNQYVITSTAGIERVTQAGQRSPISDEKAAMNVDASLDGLHVVYVVSGKTSLFVASGF